MDGQRFDRLAKAAAGRAGRRPMLKGLAAGGLAALLGLGGRRRAVAQDATPAVTGEEAPTFLFVQTFTGGSFRPNPGAGTPEADGTPVPGGGADYLLTLEGHHGETIYFSDRPQRIFGEAPTERFLEGLGFSPVNPPNAALVAQTDQGDDVVVLELVSPAYDSAVGTLTYGATILAEYQGEGLAHVAAQQVDAELPETFGRASLFIDDCADITDCVVCFGMAGCGSAGPVPQGPYGQCWSWDDWQCHPCRDYGDLDALCNQTYDDCDNNCFAG